MTQYGFYFDSTRCTGCRTCEMACKDYKDLPANHRFPPRVRLRGWRSGTTPATAPSTSDAFGLPRVAWPATTAQCRPAWPSARQGAIRKGCRYRDSCPIDEEKCTGVRRLREKLPLRGARRGHRDHEGREMRRLRRPRGRGQDARSAWTPARCGPSSSGTSKSCERRTPAPWTALPPCARSGCDERPPWPFWPARPPKSCGDTTGAIANPKEVENA